MQKRYIAVIAAFACATGPASAFAAHKPHFSGVYQFMGHSDCVDQNPRVFSGSYDFHPDEHTVDIDQYTTWPGPNRPLDHVVDSASFSVTDTKLVMLGVGWTISSHSDVDMTVQSATFITRFQQCAYQFQMFR